MATETGARSFAAWECANCTRIEVQEDEPWEFPGPENRLSRCFDTGHDWHPIRLVEASNDGR